MKGILHFLLIVTALIGVVVVCGHSRGLASTPIVPERSIPALIFPEIHLPDIHDVRTHRDPFVSPVDESGHHTALLINPPVIAQPVAAIQEVKRMILRGVVIGPQSYALVDDGERERVLRIGDSINGGIIRTITLLGVDVSNGLHLRVHQ